LWRADHHVEHITDSNFSLQTPNIIMASSLIPILVTMYVLIALISAVGKDVILDLVPPPWAFPV
jgi:hypothetical protein